MSNYNDPLIINNPRTPCKQCKNIRRARKSCSSCFGEGFERDSLRNLWAPNPGFLVCGGPSLKTINFHKLNERGVVSLGVNNVAAYAPVSAWCYSDPTNKFHQNLFLDPKIITFAPTPKLNETLYAKTEDGKFHNTDIVVRDCPNTYGFVRRTEFHAKEFLTTNFAQWGVGGNKGEGDGRGWRCLFTMLLGLRLLCYLGCPRIYLLGVDFYMDDKAQYSFNQSKKPRNGRYVHENQLLSEAKPALDAVGIEVFNCNPQSRCDVFDFVSFEDALKDCKGPVFNEPYDLSKWYDKSGVEQEIAKNKKLSREDLRLSAMKENLL